MRKNNLSKLTLSLILAGSVCTSNLAISNAFAAPIATIYSTLVIQGTAPFISSNKSDESTKNKYKIEVKRGSETLVKPKNLEVGDEIHIKFDYSDAEGDEADDFLKVENGANTNYLYVNYTDSSDNIQHIKLTPKTKAAIANVADYSFIIPPSAVAQPLQIKLQAASKYGYPREGHTIIGRLFNAENLDPESKQNLENITPEGNDKVLPSIQTLVAYIHEVESVDNKVGKSTTAEGNITLNPQVSKEYKLQIHNGERFMTDAEIEKFYTLDWFLSEDNKDAFQDADKEQSVMLAYDDAYKGKNNKFTGYTYKIGINAEDVLTVNNGGITRLKAGAQGYKIGVGINAK